MAKDTLSEEQKLMEGLKRDGLDVTVKHVDDAMAMNLDGYSVLVFPMDAGDIEQAIVSAYAGNEAIKRKPSLLLVYTISGCLDDPREIDQIPEARVSLATLYAILTREAFHRCELTMQCQMLIAIGRGVRVGTALHVDPSMVSDPKVQP